MCEEIVLSKDDYLKIMKALEKAIYVLHRRESRDHPDTRAYSLALGCEQMSITDNLLDARNILYTAISEEDYDELDDSGMLDFERIFLTDETDITILRQLLLPYITKWEPVKP